MKLTMRNNGECCDDQKPKLSENLPNEVTFCETCMEVISYNKTEQKPEIEIVLPTLLGDETVSAKEPKQKKEKNQPEKKERNLTPPMSQNDTLFQY